MTHIDQFESVFRAADKPVYSHQPLRIERVSVVTDAPAEAAARFTNRIAEFLSVLSPAPEWSTIDGDRYSSVGELLSHLENASPDLIVTYRHLHTEGWRWPHGLGEYLDVLTQAVPTPVLVVPHPDANFALPHSVQNTDRTMAITDHLVGDARLIQYAVGFTAPGGVCDLTHIEDGRAFDRWIDVISRIPEIDTEVAREKLLERLLREPQDYIARCREALRGAGVPIEIESVVRVGRRLAEYSALIDEFDVDLLVLNTKDEDQAAMHGLAHPIAVEVRQIPLLLL
ncbi:MAG: hypothetical protein AAF488_07560 [Planctomycetota bacterium]